MGGIVVVPVPGASGMMFRLRQPDDYTHDRYSNQYTFSRIWRAGISPRAGPVIELIPGNMVELFLNGQTFVYEFVRYLATFDPQGVSLQFILRSDDSIHYPSIHSYIRRFNFVRPPADPARTAVNRWAGFANSVTFSFWNVRRITVLHADLRDAFRAVFHRDIGRHSLHGVVLGNLVQPAYIFYFYTPRGVIVRFVAVFVSPIGEDLQPNMNDDTVVILSHFAGSVVDYLNESEPVNPLIQRHPFGPFLA